MKEIFIIALASVSWLSILNGSPLLTLFLKGENGQRFDYLDTLKEYHWERKTLLGYWLHCPWCLGTWIVLANILIYKFIPAFCEWFAILALVIPLHLTIKILLNKSH